MPRIATIVMGVLSGLACLIPMTVLVNATGSTVVTGFAFIALAAIAVRRQRRDDRPADLYRMPWWPLPALVALVVIASVLILGVLDPTQWVSLSIAGGIVVAGYAYNFAYLRSRGIDRFLLDADAE